MLTHARRIAPLAVVVTTAALLAGCGDGTGPAGSGSVQVTMSGGGSASGNVQVAASLTPPEARAGVVSASQVSSVEVTIQRVEVGRVGADTAASDTASDDGGWVELQVEGGSQTVDLVGLPSSDEGVAVASAELDPGDYENVRLFFSEATVTFSEEVTFPGGGGGGQGGPGGQTYGAGTAHELFVPSGAETGLEVPTASFTVDGETGATVNVLADTDASIGNIVVTGNGLLMTPVLTARAEESAGG